MHRLALIGLCLTLLLASPAFTVGTMSLLVDGQPVEAEVHTLNGAAMVPFKPLLPACGVSAYWVPDSQAISAYNAEHSLYLVMGQNSGLADGYQVPVDPPAQFIDGNPCLPLRLIVKTFQFQSMYDAGGSTGTW